LVAGISGVASVADGYFFSGEFSTDADCEVGSSYGSPVGSLVSTTLSSSFLTSSTGLMFLFIENQVFHMI
jgi:hypothetical protein